MAAKFQFFTIHKYECCPLCVFMSRVFITLDMSRSTELTAGPYSVAVQTHTGV